MSDLITYEPGGPQALDNLPPIHPGEILAEEFMVPLGLSQSGLAADLGISFRRIHDIVKGKRGISAETSLLLGRYFRMGDEFFLRLQTDYDLRLARLRIADQLANLKPSTQMGAA
ncbi:MAG: HigA family addiction module antidote protein [Candidatus Sericytochromatia bacterium]|nr:HigA family addiction module antidote protein [Candidatus Sericytochromatia bacterium]